MSILSTLRLKALLAVDFLAGIFDRGLDGAIAGLTKAERGLAAYADRLDARIDREIDARVASYERQRAAELREFAYRSRSHDRTAEMEDARERAARVRSRIGELLK